LTTALKRIIRYLPEIHRVDINAVRFQFFQASDGREFLLRTNTVAPENIKPSGSKRTPVPTAAEMADRATKAGVGELFQRTRDDLDRYLRSWNTKTTCAFGAPLPDSSRVLVVLSIAPEESSPEKGLSYKVYSKRLAKCLGVDEGAVLSHLPPNPEPYEYYANAPEDLRGWAGYIRTNEDIQKIVDLVKNIERRNSPVS
jgi:hypothetical protein